jgi:hypothetical protein
VLNQRVRNLFLLRKKWISEKYQVVSLLHAFGSFLHLLYPWQRKEIYFAVHGKRQSKYFFRVQT